MAASAEKKACDTVAIDWNGRPDAMTGLMAIICMTKLEWSGDKGDLLLLDWLESVARCRRYPDQRGCQEVHDFILTIIYPPMS